MKMKNSALSLFCSIILLSACSDDEEVDITFEGKEYKVAVVLPMDNGRDIRWKRTAEWALENIRKSQQGMDEVIRLKLEWYDEHTEDMKILGNTLANRADIHIIVGPYSSENVQTMAYQCARTNKTMIVPTASSAELIRAFASSHRFLWALTETDISQCEVLLAKAASYNAHKVALLASSSLYGQTFIDWFAFQANELGLEVGEVLAYNFQNREKNIEQVLASDADYVICIPDNMDDTKAILDGSKRIEGISPRLLFSDTAFNPSLLTMGITAEHSEGVAMYADPESGFEIAYEIRFKEVPTGAEAQFYDAIMLAAFASADCMKNQNDDTNEALSRIVASNESSLFSWDEDGMRKEFAALSAGIYYDISGAGGALDFDKKIYTNVLSSIYCNWIVYNGKFIIQDFCSTDGSNRTDATLAGWHWQVSKTQNFEDKPSQEVYAPLDENWALLVAGSKSWNNYRHQADVLNMYQILKKNGYDDDHIVLIVADDLAHALLNTDYGTIRVRPDGENLYHDLQIDYILDDIHPADISAILNGKRSERLPHVIRSDSDDNILVFWSGHGTQGQLVWSDLSKGFTTEMLEQTLNEQAANRNYRKMLWLVETCYAKSVGQAVYGHPGILCIAAADSKETSKADVYNTELGVWMSNRFTTTLTEAIQENPEISFRDLYYKLSRNTIGSHVCVVNENRFDNLYRTSIKEFITVQR